MEEIARAAGVSRTTIYRNFATREALAATVLADDVAQIERHAACFEPLLGHGRAAGLVQPVVDVDDLMLAISMGEAAVNTKDTAQRDSRHKRVREMLHRALSSADGRPWWVTGHGT